MAGRTGIRPEDLHLDQRTINTHHPRHQPKHQVHQHQHEWRASPGRGPAGPGPRPPGQSEHEARRTGETQPARKDAARHRRRLRQPDPRPGLRRAGLDLGRKQHRQHQAHTHQAGPRHALHPSPIPQPRVPPPGRGRAGPVFGRQHNQHRNGQPAGRHESQPAHSQQGPGHNHWNGRPGLGLEARRSAQTRGQREPAVHAGRQHRQQDHRRRPARQHVHVAPGQARPARQASQTRHRHRAHPGISKHGRPSIDAQQEQRFLADGHTRPQAGTSRHPHRRQAGRPALHQKPQLHGRPAADQRRPAGHDPHRHLQCGRRKPQTRRPEHLRPLRQGKAALPRPDA